MINTHKMLRPDSKGRITLGKMANGVSGFMVSHDNHRRIILEPYTEIPAQEKWLFNDPVALNKVKAGLSESSVGLTKDRGSFSQYAEEE